MREYKETFRTNSQKSASDLALYSAGSEPCLPDQGYGPIYRSYHVVHFVTAGSGELRIDDLVLPVAAGDAFVIPAGRVSLYRASHETPWTYSWINFLGMSATHYVSEITRSAPDRYVVHGLECDRYATLIQGVMGLEGEPTTQFLRGNSLLLEILAELLEDVGFREERDRADTLMDEVRFYLDMNYSKDLRLADVARRFAVSPDHLSRSFREEFGVSPKRYLMDLKFQKARGLLETTDLPVSVIARSLGFSDPLAFSRAFHRRYGLSPTAHRAGARGAG